MNENGTIDVNFTTDSIEGLIRYCEGLSGDLEERAKVLKLQSQQYQKDIPYDKLLQMNMELERMTTDATLFKMIGALATEVKELQNDKV